MGGSTQFRVETRQVEDAATTSAVDRPDGTDTGMNAMAQALALVTTGSEARIAARRAPRLAPAPAVPHGRSFACCPETDQIAVIDASGGLCEVFGEAGAGPGQFDQPSHVIVVSPRFEGEDAHVEGIALVAVADRGNNRVQIFEPEGQLVAIIGAPAGSTEIATEWRDARAGWPFFRVGGDPRLAAPVRLEWADPLLVVVGADGSRTPIDLAAALLPSFDAWLSTASRPMLAAAHHHFRHKVRSDMLAAPLAAIETALGTASLAGRRHRRGRAAVEPELAGGARSAGAGSPRRRPRSRGDGGGVQARRDRAGGRGARGHPSEPRRVRAAGAHRRRRRRPGPAPSFWGGVLRPATELVVSFAPPDIGDAEMRAVLEVLQSGWLTTGPKVKAFEAAVAAYTGAQHAVAVNSGTAALHLSLLAAGIETGRRGRSPRPSRSARRSTPSSTPAARRCFADIDLETMNIDPAAVEAAVTPRTRGAAAGALRRTAGDDGALGGIAARHDLTLVDDAAHAFGAAAGSRRIGAIGDLTAFSFHAVKNITTGEGGMVRPTATSGPSGSACWRCTA